MVHTVVYKESRVKKKLEEDGVTEEVIKTLIGDSGGYEKLFPEESTVCRIVFEIPEEEKAIEASIRYVLYLIKFNVY